MTLAVLSASATADHMPRIGAQHAVAYEISELEIVESSDGDYVHVCAASTAASKDERAHTMVQVVMDLAADHQGRRIHLYLAPHTGLCQEGRLIGETYFSPTGEGWKGLSTKPWTWQILTTGFKVTVHQIEDTLIYERHKPRFKEEFGVMNYGEPLEAYVTDESGHSPHYVTSGLWVDRVHVE